MKIKSLILSVSLLLGLSAVASPASAQVPFIGEIREVGFNFCPRGYANTDGQLIAISQNTALFSLLGTTYGGDGRTTFGLPDLRGRVSIHTGNGPGLTSRREGQRSGAETTTLTNLNVPSHTHRAGIRTVLAAPNTGNPSGATFTKIGSDVYNNGASPVPDVDPFNTSRWMNQQSVFVEPHTGGNQAVNNMQPYLVTRKCIALIGVYPSRN